MSKHLKSLLLLSTMLCTACNTYTEKRITEAVQRDSVFHGTFQLHNEESLPVVKFEATGAQLIREVNSFVNARIKYLEDIQPYAQPALATYTLRTGDCEDYALLKMHILGTNGVPAKDMDVLFGSTGTGIAHAVLRVRYKGSVLYLDNASNSIHGNPIYVPAWSVNRYGWTQFKKEAF